jgi:uncharacterized protein YndB with AHSA1/START domain
VKFVLIVVLVLVALLGVAFLIGSLLPRGHMASRAARYHQTPEAVYAALSDFPAYPKWAPEITRVERLPDMNGNPVWYHRGSRFSMPMEVLEATSPRRLEMRIADPKLPFAGTWTYEIAAVAGGSEVTVTERGAIGPPLFRFLSRFVFGYTSTMDQYLKALGRKFGENVTPQAVEIV